MPALDESNHVRHSTLISDQACEDQPVSGITRSPFYLLHPQSCFIDNDSHILSLPGASSSYLHALVLSSRPSSIPHHHILQHVLRRYRRKGPQAEPRGSEY
jgi:hypothetical protein